MHVSNYVLTRRKAREGFAGPCPIDYGGLEPHLPPCQPRHAGQRCVHLPPCPRRQFPLSATANSSLPQLMKKERIGGCTDQRHSSHTVGDNHSPFHCSRLARPQRFAPRCHSHESTTMGQARSVLRSIAASASQAYDERGACDDRQVHVLLGIFRVRRTWPCSNAYLLSASYALDAEMPHYSHRPVAAQ
jgi:hypothetical protein